MAYYSRLPIRVVQQLSLACPICDRDDKIVRIFIANRQYDFYCGYCKNFIGGRLVARQEVSRTAVQRVAPVERTAPVPSAQPVNRTEVLR